MTDLSVDELLQQGKQAANDHDNALARRLLSQVVRRDPANEQGWLWLSGVVEEPERIRYCLERVDRKSTRLNSSHSSPSRMPSSA